MSFNKVPESDLNKKPRGRIINFVKKTVNSKPKLAAIIFGVFLICVILLYTIKIEYIIVEGNSYYKDEEITSLIFEDEKNRHTFYLYIKELFGKHETIPYVQSYELEFPGLHTVKINLYEKSIIGCFYYMGSYMYFDKDGIVTDNSQNRMDDVLLVEGLDLKEIILYEKLNVKNPDVFQFILNLSQCLKREGLVADKVSFNDRTEASLFMGDVTVIIGSGEELEEKISELSSMWPKIKDLSGVLYLDTITQYNKPDRFTFDPD